MDDLLSTILVNNNNVRKTWHDAQWYYNVIDFVATLRNVDEKYARNYYHVLKNRLKTNQYESPHLIQLKVIALDGKSRFTDFTNFDGIRLLQKYIEPNTERKRTRIEKLKYDEVHILHPHIISTLMNRGYHVEHHVTLLSGSVIDIVATYDDKTYVIECKLKLSKGQLYQAIGQVLCYRSEYDPKAIPVIASYSSEFTEYNYECCRKLEIEILEIGNK